MTDDKLQRLYNTFLEFASYVERNANSESEATGIEWFNRLSVWNAGIQTKILSNLFLEPSRHELTK